MQAIIRDIINDRQAFLNEIIKNHGIDSTVYVMALEMINLVDRQLGDE